MKKIALMFASVIMIAGMFTITSCDKTNTTKPTVTLNGDATKISSLNADYTDPGATAMDSKDKALTVTTTVVPAFNKDLAGDYVYTYTATDADGNVGEAKRTVTVRNDSYGLAGTYNATDDYDNNGTVDESLGVETISVSSTVNNQLVFSKFAFYTGCALKINVSGNALSFPTPQTFFCGLVPNQQDRTFSAITGDKVGTTLTVFYHEKDADLFETDGKDVFQKI